MVRVQEGEQEKSATYRAKVSGCFILPDMFYIYILSSESADKYYIGHTDDVARRLNEHNHSDRLTFTSKYRPWKLRAVYKCSFVRNEALSIERFIKKQKSRRLIERLIEGEQMHGKLAQLVRVPHVRD